MFILSFGTSSYTLLLIVIGNNLTISFSSSFISLLNPIERKDTSKRHVIPIEDAKEVRMVLFLFNNKFLSANLNR